MSKEWLDIFCALTTPTIASLGVYIAFKQQRIDRENKERQLYLDEKKLKYALFERRIALYNTITAYIALIIQDGDINNQDSLRYLHDVKNAKFIFSEEIDDYLQQIYSHSTKLHRLEQDINGAVGDRLEAILEKREQEFNWFAQEIRTIQERFKEYLHIGI